MTPSFRLDMKRLAVLLLELVAIVKKENLFAPLGIYIAWPNSRTRRCRQPFTLKKHGGAVLPDANLSITVQATSQEVVFTV